MPFFLYIRTSKIITMMRSLNPTLRLFVFLVLALIPALLQAREIKIQIFVTADIHGRIFPYDFVNDRPGQPSLANVHYLVEIARSRNNQGVILLDNGDLIQGTPASYYANFIQDSRRNLFSRVLNGMRYDAATVGNHDIEAGPEVYNRLKNEFRFPWLGANILNESTGEPYFPPYTIIRRQGLRIAVVGLCTPSVPNWLPPVLWEGLYFQDMVEAASKWLQHIKENENPDAIIGLFHSGMGPLEPAPGDHPLEQASAYIARNLPGFDVIFTGHDHRQRVETIVNTEGKEVLIVGPGPHATTLALAELVFRRTDRRTVVLESKRGEQIPTQGIPPSGMFFQQFDKDLSEIVAYASRPVTLLTHELRASDELFGNSTFADLIHQVQLELTGAQISLTAPLSLEATLRAGQLRVRDFFRLYQYENFLYKMELSGRELLGHLEYSYGLWFFGPGEAEGHLLRFRQDAEGRVQIDRSQERAMLRHPFYNFDSAAGIMYEVNLDKPIGSRVNILSLENGEAFDLDKTYTVAINSYRGSGGGGHLTRGAGIPHNELASRIVSSTNRDFRSELIRLFSEKPVLTPETRDNWRLLPPERVKELSVQDFKLLFP